MLDTAPSIDITLAAHALRYRYRMISSPSSCRNSPQREGEQQANAGEHERQTTGHRNRFDTYVVEKGADIVIAVVEKTEVVGTGGFRRKD